MIKSSLQKFPAQLQNIHRVRPIGNDDNIVGKSMPQLISYFYF